jgi:hypothetical protein
MESEMIKHYNFRYYVTLGGVVEKIDGPTSYDAV